MKVFITRPIPDTYFHLLSESHIDIDVYEKDEVCPRGILLERARGVDALISQSEDVIDQEFFDACGDELKVIATFGVGFNNIDLAIASKRNVVVANTPLESLSQATAEGAVALLLSVTRRVHRLYSSYKNDQEIPYSPVGEMGLSVRDKTVGIVGMGKVGSKVAFIMHNGFKCKIIYYSRSKKPHIEEELDAQQVDLETLFSSSDFIFITIAKAVETTNLISSTYLDLMSENSVLVSISRTGIIDELYLRALVIKKKIYGAALDIIPEGLRPVETDNLILTNWNIATEYVATNDIAHTCIKNIIAVLNNRPTDFQVN